MCCLEGGVYDLLDVPASPAVRGSGFGTRVSEFGSWDPAVGFRVRVSGFGSQVSGSRFRGSLVLRKLIQGNAIQNG